MSAFPIASGDLVAAAYVQHAQGLTRYLTSVVRDPAIAEDLTQEAFLRLAREIDSRKAPDSIPAWLHRVGFNLATSRGRRLQVAQRFAATVQEPDAERSPEDAAVEAERHEALREALERLPPVDRLAVVLAAHGMRGPEIARRIGRTELATRTLLCRARGRLRQQLCAEGIA